MKALFTGFLTVSISTSLMIGIVLLLRFIFKKAPKALICVMWALVVVRLLLPFRIPVDFSLRPETPVITESSNGIIEQQQVYTPNELPQFVPVEEIANSNSAVVIDYMQIATIVWCAGLSAMLSYMLFTYLRMRYALRESVKREEGVYENSALPTAFLLGYLRPRIYLPSDLTGEGAGLVIRHERAHLRRGDHWLKLIAYVCLAIHWYNPLVWVMYLLLCRDIEGACDEYVIRDLDEQGRSDYSAALLSCGRGKPNFAGCPVAFGEVSIGQRIRNVLNYKKPALWICIALVVVVVFAAIFFLTDPAKPVLLDHNTLNGLIGQPIGAVCDHLGVKQEDLIPVDYARGKIASNTRYKLPFAVEYLDTEFEIYLSPNYNAGALDGTLYAFGYYATYPSEKRSDAVASAINAASALAAMYGTPDMESFSQLGDVTYSNVTKEKLENLFEQYPDRAGMGLIWDLTDIAPSNISDYLIKFKDTEHWRLNAKPNAYPQYYLQMDITQDIVSQEFRIRIICTVGTLHADQIINQGNNEVFTDAFFADVVQISFVTNDSIEDEQMLPVIQYLKSLQLTHSDQEIPVNSSQVTYGGWDVVGMKFLRKDGTHLTIRLNQWAMSGLPGGSYYITDYLEAIERGDKSLLRSLWEACGRSPEQYPFFN